MKFLFFMSLSLMGFLASAADFKDIEISTKARVAVLEVDAACVEYFNSESESDNGPVLFFKSDSYKEVSALTAQGLTSTALQNGEVCRNKADGGTMTYVTAATFSNAKFVHSLIMKNGGYKKIKVVFYDYDKLQKNFDDGVNSTLESL